MPTFRNAGTRPRQDGFGEIFGKGSLVPTPTEERALYVEALSGELARTLESVEGVTSARVGGIAREPITPRNVARQPVSYTHLTLPTNREV